MKKMILMAMITISTVGFAQLKENKVVNRAEAREKLAQIEAYTKYKTALESGKMTDAIKKTFEKYINDSLATITGVKADSLISIINVVPDSASKITELMTLAKYGTAEQKAKATNDLKIIADGALLIDSSTEVGIDEAKALVNVSDMADYNEKAKLFKSELAKELKRSASVTEAVSKASKTAKLEITLDKIKDCI